MIVKRIRRRMLGHISNVKALPLNAITNLLGNEIQA
jgi:hypothetical protein